MIITKTPYRISFFGGGSDYPSWYKKNGGAVLSSTIDKHIYITCRFSPGYFKQKYRIVWRKIENVKKVKSCKDTEYIFHFARFTDPIKTSFSK